MGSSRGDEDRLGTLGRRVNSMDQRLDRVEGKQEAMLARQHARSEQVAPMDRRFAQRFDDMERVVVEISDTTNSGTAHG